MRPGHDSAAAVSGVTTRRRPKWRITRRKPKDPTEEALSPSRRRSRPDPAGAYHRRPTDAAPAQPAPPTSSADTGRDEPRRCAAPPMTTAQPVGQILQALQRRPSRAPYIVAALASAVWVAGGARPRLLFGTRIRRAACQPARRSPLVALAAGIVVPVVLFYVLAHMVRRAQDLRIVAGRWPKPRCGSPSRRPIARESIVVGRPGDPPRGRGHGRRRRTRARARRRTRSAGAQRSRPRSSAPTTTTKCASAA